MIVTGGSRGIGAAVARLAAERGYAVCIAYRSDAEAAAAVVEDIVTRGGVALAVKADTGVEADVRRLFDSAQAALGPIDVLVDNAGILERQARVEAIDAARLSRVFTTNVIGVFLCSAEAVRRMSTKHGGHGGSIVNVSSRAARLGSPGEYVDYAASKAAVDTLTMGLSKEVATEGIRVNAVSPGLIHTEIHARGGEPGRVDRLAPGVPMQRGGTAEEVASAILWLASDEATYCTGTNIDVAGGR